MTAVTDSNLSQQFDLGYNLGYIKAKKVQNSSKNRFGSTVHFRMTYSAEFDCVFV